MQVVGYEGNKIDNNLPLVWGAAAIIDGNKLINAVTGYVRDKSYLEKYIKDGVICPTEVPINIKKIEKYFVLNIRKELAFREPYRVPPIPLWEIKGRAFGKIEHIICLKITKH